VGDQLFEYLGIPDDLIIDVVAKTQGDFFIHEASSLLFGATGTNT
jgi:hypothetical protein